MAATRDPEATLTCWMLDNGSTVSGMTMKCHRNCIDASIEFVRALPGYCRAFWSRM